MRFAAVLVSFAVCGCASNAAKPAASRIETPPAATSTAPPRSLASSIEQGTSLLLHLRADGEPVRGRMAIVPLPEGKAPSAPGTPDDALLHDDRVELEARDGVVEVPASAMATLSPSAAFDLVVSGARYPLVLPSGTNPFRCAESLDAGRKLDACTTRLPSDESVPPTCDDSGRAAWRSILASKRDAFAACWSKLDAATFAALADVRDGTIRHRACEELVRAAGPSPSESDAIDLVVPCESELPPDVAAPAMKKRRTRDLPAAFAAAAQGSSAEMQRFVVDYRVTGDPRVEEIRQLAIRRFGPSDPKRFETARKRLATMRFGGWRAQLCDLAKGVATVTVVPRYDASLEPPDPFRRADATEPATSRTCMVARPRIVPESVKRSARAAAAMLTGASRVELAPFCQTHYWFFDAG